MSAPGKWDSDSLLQLGRSFFESRVFLTAVDFDLFSLLTEVPLTAAEVADHKRTDLRATTTLLDALAAMGLLDKRGDAYRTDPGAAPFLLSDGERSVLPMLAHASSMWERWSGLTGVIRSGKPEPRQLPDEESEKRYRAFVLAMHVIGRARADQIAAAIDLSDRRRLLDVGGATGTYTQAFLKAQPEMKATLFDLPPVVRLAQERLTREGYIQHVTLREGDFYTDDLPGGHDLALLSAIIHQNSRVQNRELYRKVYAALEPGGRLIIRDHIMEPSRTEPPSGALFAINMLVATEAGGTYTFDEIREDLEASGFCNVRLLQADERMNGLVQASRS